MTDYLDVIKKYAVTLDPSMTDHETGEEVDHVVEWSVISGTHGGCWSEGATLEEALDSMLTSMKEY